METRMNSAETQQSGHAQRSRPEIKNRRSSAKGDAPEVQTQDYPEGGELDSVVDDRRRCKKNFTSVLSCIGKRAKKAVTVAEKSEQFTLGEARKVQFL